MKKERKKVTLLKRNTEKKKESKVMRNKERKKETNKQIKCSC